MFYIHNMQIKHIFVTENITNKLAFSLKMTVKTITNEDKILSTMELSIALTKEEKMNNFLDEINHARNFLKEVTSDLHELTDKLEELSWLDNFTTEDSILMKACIISTQRLIKFLNKTYAKINRSLKPLGVCRIELKNFIESIRDLEESKNDVNLAFFVLPFDEENKHLDKEIAKLF